MKVRTASRKLLREAVHHWLAMAGLTLVALLTLPTANAEHVRDLAVLQGVRDNELHGVGLVVGLDGTGDQTTQTPFTTQSLQTMLQQLGITLPAGTPPQLRNVAFVAVTAVLPPFAQPGQALDVTVTSMGNAKSLKGGLLLSTPLRGGVKDSTVYAVAQGNVLVGGAGASANGSKVQINQLNGGRIPGGASVEHAVPTPFLLGDSIRLELKENDFAMAAALADAINAAVGEGTAEARDARVIDVKAPKSPNARVKFVAMVQDIDVARHEPEAKIVINSRTGSIVFNRTVTLEPAAVAHGNLSVTITSTPVVSQPGPLSSGQTTVSEKTDISVKQDGGVLMTVPAATNLADLVKALNALGANPADLVSILQALRAAGSLRADVEVI